MHRAQREGPAGNGQPGRANGASLWFRLALLLQLMDRIETLLRDLRHNEQVVAAEAVGAAPLVLLAAEEPLKSDVELGAAVDVVLLNAGNRTNCFAAAVSAHLRIHQLLPPL